MQVSDFLYQHHICAVQIRLNSRSDAEALHTAVPRGWLQNPVTTDFHVKMFKFTALKSMLTAQEENGFNL